MMKMVDEDSDGWWTWWWLMKMIDDDGDGWWRWWWLVKMVMVDEDGDGDDDRKTFLVSIYVLVKYQS
jgi:hypothetical protein